MMGDTLRIPLALAEALAAQVVALLEPACSRIAVAGSIRRRKADIGDIELVVVPKLHDSHVFDLFGARVEAPALDLLDDLVHKLLLDETFERRRDKNGRPALGTRYRRLTYRGFGVDLFSCLPPAQFGLLLVIRTGPADFSRKLVTSRLLGGWLPPGARVHDGAIWQGDTLVPTSDEESVFAFCGLHFLPPEERTDTVVPRRRRREVSA